MNETRDDDPESGSGRRALFSGIGQLCEIVVRLTGVDGAAVALFTANGVVRELVYASDVIAQQLDDLQFTLGEGPCIDSFTLRRWFLVEDVSDRTGHPARWPMFATEASGLGVEALFTFPVADDEAPLGVLELYRRTTGPLSEEQLASAAMCAQAAAVTVRRNWDVYTGEHGGEQADDLARDLADTDGGDEGSGEFGRARIYLASGMIAVQLSISPDEALDRLRALSFRQGRPIKDVAEDVVNRTMSLRDEDENEDQR